MRRPRPVAWLKAHPVRGGHRCWPPSWWRCRSSGLWSAATPTSTIATPTPWPSCSPWAARRPLAWRRRRPFGCFLVVAAASVATAAVGYPDSGREPRRPGGGLHGGRPLRAPALARGRRRSPPSALLRGPATARWDVDLGTVVSNFVIFGTAWILGDNLRTRRAYVAGPRGAGRSGWSASGRTRPAGPWPRSAPASPASCTTSSPTA